jgi:hypothetical protein
MQIVPAETKEEFLRRLKTLSNTVSPASTDNKTADALITLAQAQQKMILDLKRENQEQIQNLGDEFKNRLDTICMATLATKTEQGTNQTQRPNNRAISYHDNRNQQGQDIQCYNCKRYGHFAAGCPTRPPRSSGRGRGGYRGNAGYRGNNRNQDYNRNQASRYNDRNLAMFPSGNEYERN